VNLDTVVPWGRSFDEYRSMFSLTESDLKKNILGCGDGPASFNAELTAIGGNIVSIDPIYEFTAAQVRSRIDSIYHQIMSEMEENKEAYVWRNIQDVAHLGEVRMGAIETFLSDYECGCRESRYIKASLPDLPFSKRQFELALCSHLLFLYSEQISLDQHVQGMKELCRVADEVRVYPLLALNGNISSHIEPVTAALEDAGISVSVKPVGYEFQKGAVEMLIAKHNHSSMSATTGREEIQQ